MNMITQPLLFNPVRGPIMTARQMPLSLTKWNRILEEFSKATDPWYISGIKAFGDPKHKQFVRCKHAHQRQPQEALLFHLREQRNRWCPRSILVSLSPAVAQSTTGEREPSPASLTTAKRAEVGTLATVQSSPQAMKATPVHEGGSLYGGDPAGSIGTCSSCPVLARASTAGSASKSHGKTQEAMANETAMYSSATASTHDTASPPAVMNPAPSLFKVYGKSGADWPGIAGAHATYYTAENAAVTTSAPSVLRHIPSPTTAHAAV